MKKNILLWLVAVLLMLAAVMYQRYTGPTKPYRGKVLLSGEQYRYALLRSHNTTSPAVISLPELKNDVYTAFLHYKRYGTNDEWTEVEMLPQDGNLSAELPLQPAAGKMEYYLTGESVSGAFRIPEAESETIILRYKDPVPPWVLVPHIIMMFFSVLFGMRAGISALFQPESMRKWAKVALIGMTVGGMILGPIVQKYAFGEYWTGFPYGKDYTDNKMLIMWLSWLVAMLLIGWKSKDTGMKKRLIIVLASVVMTITYLIPHSMGGSSLDYSKVDQGIDPYEAIKTGKD